MQYLQTRNNHWLSPEFWLTAISMTLGSIGIWYVYSLGLVRKLTDAYAHLNFSKMFFESLTPGISQIGFWPPLLHLLMAPFTKIGPLYDTGLAGAVVILPFYVLGTVFCYKLVRIMTDNSVLGWTGAAFFMLNPYIIYYTATPMMEVMFIGNLMAVAYFVGAWLKRGWLSDLVWMALFVTLATLSRFEGMLLLPLIVAILVISLWKKKRDFSEIQAVLLLFGMLAIVGSMVIVAYSWFFGGSPIAFTGGDWVKSASSTAGFQTQKDMLGSLQYVLYATRYMLGENLVYFAFICLPFLALVARNRLETFSVLAVLASPVAFIIIALYSGSYNIALPELPPYKLFLNERYGLTWIGFLIVAPLLTVGYTIKYAMGNRILRFAAKGVSVLAIIALLFSSGDFLYQVAAKDKYFVINDNINTPRGYHYDLAGYLSQNYDYGKILLTRADNDPVLGMSGIPLSEYIYEANYLYFSQSLDEPWLFARWVVAYNRDNQKEVWAQPNEVVSARWVGQEQFEYFYEKVYQSDYRIVYKIRDERVLAYARENNFNPDQIPSINRNMIKWNPTDFYNNLQKVSLNHEKKN